MTDRYNAITVVLDDDYREDAAKPILDAIRMIKGVLSATPRPLATMIELDSDKWLAIKIACEAMTSRTTEPRLHAVYEWLVDVASHNAHVALSTEDYDRKSNALVQKEPR